MPPPGDFDDSGARENSASQRSGRLRRTKAFANAALKRLLAFPPLLQFRIAPRLFERGHDRGLLRVVRAGTAGHQYPSGLDAVHVDGACAVSLAIMLCSEAMPRAIRDFTVPSGTPRISAMSR